MILQKVKLAKSRSKDDHWHIPEGVATVGTEFWVVIREIKVQTAKNRETGEVFRSLMVPDKTGTWLPVELLEFTNEFEVTG